MKLFSFIFHLVYICLKLRQKKTCQIEVVKLGRINPAIPDLKSYHSHEFVFNFHCFQFDKFFWISFLKFAKFMTLALPYLNLQILQSLLWYVNYHNTIALRIVAFYKKKRLSSHKKKLSSCSQLYIRLYAKHHGICFENWR